MRRLLCLVVTASLLAALGCSGRSSTPEKKKDDGGSFRERLPGKDSVKEKGTKEKAGIGAP
jgi:hypothetical protein